MVWTYNAQPFVLGAVATNQNNRDTVRFLLGDTDTNDQQLQDSEIDGLLLNTVAGERYTNYSAAAASGIVFDPFQAAMAACVGLSAKYSRRSNKTTGDLSISAGMIAGQYMKLRQSIEKQARRYTVPQPYAGGQSKSDMENDANNDDAVQPSFGVGMTDNHNESPDFNTGGGFTQVVPG